MKKRKKKRKKNWNWMRVKTLIWQAEIVGEAQVGAGGGQSQFVVQREPASLALIKNLVSFS
jgi:hypothetical protein